MTGTNFIPRADDKFLVWLKVLIAYLIKNQTGWRIPLDELKDLAVLEETFEVSLAIAEDPSTRTPVSIKAKNDARKAVESSTRTLLKAYVTYNPLVTDADREAMGLPVHKTTRTPVPTPVTFPEAEVRLPSPAVVEIHFRDSQSEHRAKPAGVHGAEISWAIFDEAPVDWKQLTHSSFDTHTPLRLTFEGADRGKTLYFALRWENTRGEKGPWSEILNVIIP
ncbi:MAG: hypothetical protein LBB41_03905 [Prevotellaceae bacterium]|jgi:hypothetical protein|nr:hypothetical protein [Prevotellaceae bacterium]